MAERGSRPPVRQQQRRAPPPWLVEARRRLLADWRGRVLYEQRLMLVVFGAVLVMLSALHKVPAALFALGAAAYFYRVYEHANRAHMRSMLAPTDAELTAAQLSVGGDLPLPPFPTTPYDSTTHAKAL